MLHPLLAIAAFTLLFSSWIRVGFLAQRVLPSSAPVHFTGVAITTFGVALAIWARDVLGRNWSATPAIMQHHALITRGPYRFVRHPIYTGIFIAMVGSAITFGLVACFLSLPIGFATWWLKSHLEESLLVQEFGENYQQYRDRVKQILIPFVF